MGYKLCLFGLCLEGIANVKCLITRMTSWYNARGARIGKQKFTLLYSPLLFLFVVFGSICEIKLKGLKIFEVNIGHKLIRRKGE